MTSEAPNWYSRSEPERGATFRIRGFEKDQASLQQDVKIWYDRLVEAKNKFETKIKWDDNSKAFD